MIQRCTVLVASALLVSTPALADSLELSLPSNDKASYSYRTTDTLIVAGLGFAGLHMADNVLSKRTFASGTTGPTLVQAAYVGAAVAYSQEAGPLVWTVGSLAMLASHSIGHYLLPSAEHHISTFHDTWTAGPNRLGIESGGVGRASQGILIGLDLTFAAVLVSSIRDGVHCGFTLRRRTRCR